MATVILRFRKNLSFSVEELGLQSVTGAVVSVDNPLPREVLDITIDDAVANAQADIEEFMVSQGYALIGTDPADSLAQDAADSAAPTKQIEDGSGTVYTFPTIANGEGIARSGGSLVSTSLGGGGTNNRVLDEDWFSGGLDQDELGAYGWRVQSGGTGSIIFRTGIAGRGAVLGGEFGTAAGARSAVYLDPQFRVDTDQPELLVEWLIRLENSLAVVDFERFTCGFGDQFGSGSGGAQHDNGVYVEFNPNDANVFRLRTASASTRSASNGTTVVALNTWYRVGVRMTYPGGTPTAHLVVNGVDEGSSLTANIPTVDVGYGIRGDAGDSVGTEVAWFCQETYIEQSLLGED